MGGDLHLDKDGYVIVTDDGIEVIDMVYSDEIEKHFKKIPNMAKTLINEARQSMNHIEGLLYKSTAFFSFVKSILPEDTLQAVLSDEQKEKLANGVLKLMTKKDGTLMANLVDPKTSKIVKTIPLEYVSKTPALAESISNFTSQMQMAEIAEKIRDVQVCIEEVMQGQENDRLALAYSCQQKLIQASAIRKPELKAMALMRIASDAEDSRNQLMLSQKMNVDFIKKQPESTFKKLISGAKPEKIEEKMNAIRESLGTVNMVSLAEAMAYQLMGEYEAAQKSLGYYATFLQSTYLEAEGLVQRLDLIDKSPVNYWSKALPEIHSRILALPMVDIKLITQSGGGM